MASIPSLLPIRRAQDAFTPAGEPTDNGFDSRPDADALKTARQHGVRH
jgi:hypothetical protein